MSFLWEFVRDPAGIALLIVIAATVWFARDARGRQAPTALVVVGTFDFFYGFITLALASLHLTAVIAQALLGRGSGSADTFVYDFRFYSLILVGAVIAVAGFLCLICARGLTRADTLAWKKAVWSTVVLLAINVPLMPIQGFAPGLAVFALLNLAALAASRKLLRA